MKSVMPEYPRSRGRLSRSVSTERRPQRRSDVPAVQPARPGFVRRWLAGSLVDVRTAFGSRHTTNVDPVLAISVLGLLAFGVVMVYSASAVYAERNFHNGEYFVTRQIIFALAGVAVLAVVSRVPLSLLRRFTYPALAVTVGLLLFVVLGFGHASRGSARWISMGSIHIQPAELAKLAVILYLADSLAKKRHRVGEFSIGILPHALVAGLLIVLCMAQPDFGSSVVIALMTALLLFTSGARTGYLLGALALALPTAAAIIASSEYRKERVRAFLAPFEHRFDIGYQIVESLLSFGAGGTHGVGLGDGTQKLLFLPEAHTDFIAAIIGEELGFVGVVAVVLVFALIFARGLRAAFFAGDDYAAFLGIGMATFIVIQAFTNLAVVMGMLPTKGLALPFLSYGGSSLLVNCFAAGVLLNLSRFKASAHVRDAAIHAQMEVTA